MRSNRKPTAQKLQYAEYLKSNHWAVLKLSKILQEDKVCASCGTAKNVQLHHMFYRPNIEDTELEDTCWLCRSCHKIFHLVIGIQLKQKKKTPDQLRQETVRIISAAIAKRKREAAQPKPKKARIWIDTTPTPKKRHSKKRNKGNSSDFDRSVSRVEPRSALASSMAGKVVAVNPKIT